MGNSAATQAQSVAPAPNPARRRTLRKVRQSLFWYLLLSPSLLIIFGFSTVPLVWSIYYSLTKGSMLGPKTFVGLDNYVRAATHPIFLRTLRNTFYYAVLTVPTVIVLAVVIAIIIFQIPRGQGFFRGTFYFPLITPVVIAANIWAYIVNRDFGPLNHILGWFRGAGHRLAGHARLRHTGDCDDGDLARFRVLRDRALCRSPVHPARTVRGRAHRRRPVLADHRQHHPAPAASGPGLLLHHGDHLQFPAVRRRVRPDPRGAGLSTSTVSWYVYQQAFESDNIGFASTMGVVLLAIILTLSLIQLRFFRSDIEY